MIEFIGWYLFIGLVTGTSHVLQSIPGACRMMNRPDRYKSYSIVSLVLINILAAVITITQYSIFWPYLLFKALENSIYQWAVRRAKKRFAAEMMAKIQKAAEENGLDMDAIHDGETLELRVDGLDTPVRIKSFKTLQEAKEYMQQQRVD